MSDIKLRIGFASWKNRSYELIVWNIETGEEITLHGKLLHYQDLEMIDKILPTCVYVEAIAADPKSRAP